MPVSADALINPSGERLVQQIFESAFPWSILGRRFVATHQTPGTLVTAQTAFVATTPTLLLRQNGTNIDVVLRSLTLSQGGIVAGGLVNYIVLADTVDRFSAGGTAVVAQSLNLKANFVTQITGFLINPTATADTGTRRVVAAVTAPASLGLVTTIPFKDGLIIGPTGALLVYAFAAVTAPQLYFNVEWAERDTT